MATIKELALAGSAPVNNFNNSLISESDTVRISAIQRNVLLYATSVWFPRPSINLTWAKVDSLFGANQKIAFKVTEIFNNHMVRYSAIKLPPADESSIRANTADDGIYYFIWNKSIYDVFKAYHSATTTGLSIYLGVDTGGNYEISIIRRDLSFGPVAGPPYAGAKIPNT